MSHQTDIDKDPFLVLLTDALRAGPGSPEWRDAVAKLKASGESVDEYRLLIEAREALESGKDYRSVRAGPGFTRKLLTNIEGQESKSTRSFPVAGLMAVLAGLLIVVVVALAIFEFYPRGSVAASSSRAIDDLAGTYLPNQVLASTFQNGVPPAWRKIGSLPLDASDGLSAGSAPASAGSYSGGGVVLTEPMAADQTFSITAIFHVKNIGNDLIPQIFVSNSPDFSQDRATSAQELVWQLQGQDQNVIVSGRVERQAPLPARIQTLLVRVMVNRDLAIVETNNQRLWAGANGLGDQPRYLGVRFIRTNGKPVTDITVQSVRVQRN